MSKPNGTFLLRFSDSEIGGITIAWVAENPNKAGTSGAAIHLILIKKKKDCGLEIAKTKKSQHIHPSIM